MNSIEDGKRVEIVDPLHFRFGILEFLLLKPPQGWERLDDPVFDCLEDLAGHRAEDIPGELPIVGPPAHQGEACGLAESGPHLLKLNREDLSEDRAHADVREKVSLFADPGTSGSIIAAFGI